MSDIKAIETYYKGYRFRSRLEARWAVFFDALGVEYEYEPEGFELPSGKMYLPDFKVKCWGKRGNKSGPPTDLWIEVKGNMTQGDSDRIKEFAFAGFAVEYCAITECPGFIDGNYYPLELSASSDYDDNNRRWCCACGRVICKYGERIPKQFYCEFNDKNVEVSECPTIGAENPVLIVNKIPGERECWDWYKLHAGEKMNGIDIYPFNYKLIDGDYFGAYPAADEHGHFYLWGDDSNYINSEDIERVERAYRFARQARFEHGEKPIF